MFAYCFRRLCYSVPILLGVSIITFVLFFVVNSPDDMARAHLGNKHVSQEMVDQWKHQHGYDKPVFYNASEQGIAVLTQTLFFKKCLKLFLFDFGVSDAGRDISEDIGQRMWPSLALAIPVLWIGLMVNITFAMIMTYCRGTVFDISSVVLCIIMMSISALFYIIGGQYIFGKMLKWVPISGYVSGFTAVKFVILPVMISVIGGLGAGSRWYRTIFLEEANKDYVRTARAKGLSEMRVVFKHVLPNAMIPILTGLVVIIPSLFIGSLLMESFFGIPGMGSYTIDAINSQDFAVVRVMVFLGTVLYLLGLLLTDVSYAWADPRVRLE